MSARSGGKELAGLALHPFRRLYRSGLLDRFTPAQSSFPLIRPSPVFFFPLSPIGRMASRFGHAALGCGFQVIPHSDAGSRNTHLCHPVLQCSTKSCRALMRHPGIPASLPVRFTFLDPASLCGVTRCASSAGWHPLSCRAPTRYPEIFGGVAPLLFLLCHELDLASECGMTLSIAVRCDRGELL